MEAVRACAPGFPAANASARADRAASREFHTAQSSGCERYYDSGFEVTLELTFSYIVSLSVSENVSGVAIFASKLAAREKNRVRWIVRVWRGGGRKFFDAGIQNMSRRAATL